MLASRALPIRSVLRCRVARRRAARSATATFSFTSRGPRRGQTARVNDVRALSDDQFVVRAEVMIDDQVVTPLTSIMRLKDGLIIEGRSYLAEAATLERMGMIPEPD